MIIQNIFKKAKKCIFVIEFNLNFGYTIFGCVCKPAIQFC